MRSFQVHSGQIVRIGEAGEPVLIDSDWEPKIEDIAHGLSRICRFGGHVDPEMYSVAQHTVLCAEAARDGGYDAVVQLACLLHDANEAYNQDVISPVKAAMRRYQTSEGLKSAYDVIELSFQERIALAFLGKDATAMFSQVVNYYDIAMFVTESQQVRTESPETAEFNKAKFPAPLAIVIDPWPSWKAKEKFLNAYADLKEKIERGRTA